MQTRALGKTGIEIAPIVLGGNVFGWTIDEAQSFRVLDAFVDHGFDAIDTADVYSRWAAGNRGGESETIIGKWLGTRARLRDRVKVFTKVGSDMGKPGHKGLGAAWIMQAVEESLRRLQLERIDLYFSHWPDATPHEETLDAYDRLLRAGKIRAIGCSNFDAPRLRAALDIAVAEGLPRYQVVQAEYNLYDRASFEGPLRDLCLSEHIGVISYYALASGFLTGKYRSADDRERSLRGEKAGGYLTPKGLRLLDALDRVADAHGAQPAEVALAWLIGRKGITAPISSATSEAQVVSFARATLLTLSGEEIDLLTRAGD